MKVTIGNEYELFEFPTTYKRHDIFLRMLLSEKSGIKSKTIKFTRFKCRYCVMCLHVSQI